MRVSKALRGPWAVAIAAAAVGLGIHLWAGSLPRNQRLPPSLETLAWVSAFVGMTAMMWAMVRGVRTLVGSSETAARPLKIGGLVLLHLTLVLGVPLGMLTSDPGFPFGSSYVSFLDGRDGERFYLYSGGLFCRYEVYVRKSRSFYLRLVDRISPKQCTGDVGLVWDDTAGRPIVMRPDGERIVTRPWTGLYWGPH